MIARLLRDLLDTRTYGRILYLLLALPLGIVEFTFLVTAIALGLGLAVTLVGIPILVAVLYVGRWAAGVERRLIGVLTGREIPSPYRPLPPGSWWDRLRARFADPATWEDLAFLLLQLPLGIVSFSVAAVVMSAVLFSLTSPAWYWALPGGIDLGIIVVDSLWEALAFVPLGVVLAFVGIPALGALGRLYGELAALLLGSNADPLLTAEVSDLRDARSRIIAAADAERRRIERDLHDGAQQRLVALALRLRLAEQRAAAGDPATPELVRSAGEEAGLALKELRDLARGIHPAILTNRGLPAALEDLAGRASVPVEVSEAPSQRLPEQVEAAAYFAVSECLANLDKHAAASRATVGVSVSEGIVSVLVTDDGVGGAGLEGGSGLQGLRDRVGALDGRLAVESAPGEGTRVRAAIPLEVPVADVASTALIAGPCVLPDEQAAVRRTTRRRRLRVRLVALGILAATLVGIWALTGSPSFWPVWPLLGLVLVGGLDTWFVLANPPWRESDLAGGAALRTLLRRRRLLLKAGALGIVNLVLLGIWLAGGGAYFWPLWPMLGSAIAIALNALPITAALRERYLGPTG
jgi:signal transduction histidine kinase